MEEFESTVLYVQMIGARLKHRANALWIGGSLDQLVWMNRTSELIRRTR